MVFTNRIRVVAVAWLALYGGAIFAADAEKARSSELYQQTFGADTPDERKMPEALKLWRKLAEQGDVNAMYYLSAVYFRGIPDLVEVDNTAALSLLEKSAAKGLPDAQFSLAWQYESGAKVKQDLERAFLLYEGAARQGYSLAISRLIRVFANGELGRSPDPKQAQYWQQKTRVPTK